MIIDIPTKDDFDRSGRTFLNLAWDAVIDLLFDVHDSTEDEEDSFESDEYWKAAQGKLSMALALAEQGIEFLLKARIVEVSPFLLISRNPRDWPSGCEKQDLPFASFRTVDAQDLLRVHDTVAQMRLPDKFKSRYEQLRRKRNVILHTIARDLRISAKEVVLEILEASNSLIAEHAWLEVRRIYLKTTPLHPAFYSHEDDQDEVIENDELLMETDTVIESLSPSEAESLLGFYKRRRRYYCPTCYTNAWKHAEDIPRLAQLSDKSSRSGVLHCIVCGSNISVMRVRCMYDDCKGNVISEPMLRDSLGYHYPYLPEGTSWDEGAIFQMRNEKLIQGETAYPVCLSCWRYQVVV